MESVHSIDDFVTREGRAGLVEVLDALAEAVFIVAPDGEIEFANRAACTALGRIDGVRLREETYDAVLDQWRLTDEAGAAIESEQLVRGVPSRAAVRAVHQGTGELRWWRVESRPLQSAGGDEVARLVALDDVTAVKEAELRMRVLADSGRALVASLDYEQTLANVAHMAVPALADWCAVYLTDEQLGVRRVVAAHRNPEKQALADRLRGLQGERVDAQTPLGRVIQTGVPFLIEKISDEQLTQRARTAKELRLIRALALRSYLVVPMRVPTRTLGAMMLATDDDSGRGFTNDDQELAEQLGRRAAVAIENARLYRQLGDIAETLARSFLPSELPEISGWEVASLYRPVVSEARIDLGGDFLELLTVGPKWFAVIGDIEGKGVLAATISALMRHGARLAAQQRPEPASVLAQLDEALRGYPSEITCTMLCALLGSTDVTVASAGHPPPLVSGADGITRELQVSGPLLGVFGDGDWRQRRFEVGSDELVVLYTDGITEALGGRSGVGRDRLRRLLSQEGGRRPAEVVEALDRALAGVAVRDDLAALVLRRR